MSYNFGKRLRQPGGRLTVCRPDSTASVATPSCDCFFCNNNGRPANIFAGFSGFWGNVDGATGDGSNGNCASLNIGNTVEPPPDPRGYLLTFHGSNCNLGVDDQIVVWADGVGTVPFNSNGCACTYRGAASSLLGDACLSGGWTGSWLQVTVGWSEAAGVFVIVQLRGGDEFGDGPLLYQWNWHHLETFNDPPGGAWPLGQINCCGDSSQRNSLYSLLLAAQTNQQTGPNNLYGGWVAEYVSATGCYQCLSGNSFPGENGTQAAAKVGLLFSAGGDTKVAPPCCCGGRPQQCLWLCIEDPECPTQEVNIICCHEPDGTWKGNDLQAGGNTTGTISFSNGAFTVKYSCAGGTKTETFSIWTSSPFTASGGTVKIGTQPPCTSNCDDVCLPSGPLEFDLDLTWLTPSCTGCATDGTYTLSGAQCCWYGGGSCTAQPTNCPDYWGCGNCSICGKNGETIGEALTIGLCLVSDGHGNCWFTGTIIFTSDNLAGPSDCQCGQDGSFTWTITSATFPSGQQPNELGITVSGNPDNPPGACLLLPTLDGSAKLTKVP